ncbi:MAG: hypothetical protein LBT52_00065, partial [Clostridiales Family XIII bacterium]|nr:hypothetical protein [Clostridiales Family XIII bacterium]
MKTKIATRIVSNTEISKGIYRLALAGAPGSGGLSDIADTAAPGQFVNVYLNNKTMLLPRPFGISNIEINADGEAGADGKTCEGGGTGVDGETREGDGTGVDGETREGDGTGVDGGTNRSNDESHIVLVYAVVGAGTAELASCVPGAAIQILGPQGNGYDLDALGRHVLLIGGGLGIPPLLFAARRIRESALPQGSMKITALLGYRDVPYYA